MESVLDARRAGDWRGALRTAAVCLRLHARDPYYYKPFAYSVLPLAIVDWYRQKIRRQENHHAREAECPSVLSRVADHP
jgi:hypothetical protein